MQGGLHEKGFSWIRGLGVVGLRVVLGLYVLRDWSAGLGPGRLIGIS